MLRQPEPFFTSWIKQSKSLKLCAWQGRSRVAATARSTNRQANLIKQVYNRTGFIRDSYKQRMIQSNTESQLHTGGVRRRIDDLKKLIVAQQFKQSSQQMTQHQSSNSSCIQIAACQPKCNHNTTVPLEQQTPIILEKQRATQRSSRKVAEKSKIPDIPQVMSQPRRMSSKLKLVEAFEPIEIPLRERKMDLNMEPVVQCKPVTKEIQINIEKEEEDNKSKDCLKKLFKKINKLTEELNSSERDRERLKLELQFQGKTDRKASELQRQVRDLEGDRHKLKLELATLREMLALEKSKPPQVIQKIVNQPIQIIKQVPVEKIVEVKVQVPKHIPGPERIVERKIQVPKIIEVEKKVPVEIIKEVIKEVPREIIKTIEIPSYIEKPVYIDKPIYVDRIVENKVQVPVEVPIEVPVYIDRPVFQSQPRDSSMQEQIKFLLAKNTTLQTQLSSAHRQIQQYRLQVEELYRNIEVLRRHNQDKNREVEALIQNSFEQYNSMDVLRYRPPMPIFGSPLPPSAAGSYLTGNYTISSDSIPPLGARPRFI